MQERYALSDEDDADSSSDAFFQQCAIDNRLRTPSRYNSSVTSGSCHDGVVTSSQSGARLHHSSVTLTPQSVGRSLLKSQHHGVFQMCRSPFSTPGSVLRMSDASYASDGLNFLQQLEQNTDWNECDDEDDDDESDGCDMHFHDNWDDTERVRGKGPSMADLFDMWSGVADVDECESGTVK